MQFFGDTEYLVQAPLLLRLSILHLPCYITQAVEVYAIKAHINILNHYFINRTFV